jgi:hypothetical protein
VGDEITGVVTISIDPWSGGGTHSGGGITLVRLREVAAVAPPSSGPHRRLGLLGVG